jgi:catechol 2,3-dioxygenase-like lactoylglutathione lyase family enzyme
MEKITANLMVTDMHRSLDFYCELLGFTLTMGVNTALETFTDGVRRDDLIFVLLAHGSKELMLQRRDSLAKDVPGFTPHTTPCGTFTLYFRGEPADALAARLPNSVEKIKGPETSWYGMRELYIRDPDGYVLAFGTPDGAPTELNAADD